MKHGTLMDLKWWATLLLTSFVWMACSDANEEPTLLSSSSPAAGYDGFVLIHSYGQKTTLGTNEIGARTSDVPEMNVRFTYDFYISKYEVTRGEYLALRPDAGAECESECSDNIPVTNVTYYDAVLYANAKSKAEKLDTVYTYKSASFNESGSCDNLVGLNFHANANGYRLPTEAEWVYVASQDWNPAAGWNSENSDYALHDVATSSPNALNVFDMAGNALEWVNDWLTYFRQEPVTNFVGASDGGSLGERVVKGGSYRSDPVVMNTFSRGDVYTVTSSTKGNYLGFRLAIGAIPNPMWLDESGKVKESVVNIFTSVEEMKHLTGTFASKMAFRNGVTGNLSYVDFGSGVFSAVEIVDSLDVYHPDISPDGKRVAFCTGMEGVSASSSVYVRNLDAKGSELVKLDVENAVIPRWRVLANGDTVIVYVTSAANNKDNATFANTSTWQVAFANGKFGTPEKLFDGAYHGGVNDERTLAVTGARLLRARVADEANGLANGRDMVWYGGEQACNVSLANDGSNRTAFLDFASKTGIDFVGSSYRSHERLFVADANGKLIQSVAAPKGYSFDHTEWAVGGSNTVVATLANVNGAHEKVAIVNLSDSSVTVIADGDEIWHPCLWHFREIYDSDELNTDSAGVYYTSNAYYSALELSVKMERFWENRDEATAVALGSSRTLFGVYEKDIKSHKLLNMAYSVGQMTGIYYLFKNYVMNHLKNLKVLVLELSPDFFWYDGFSTWTGIVYNQVPGFRYDENHDFWVNGLPEHFIDAMKLAPRPETALKHPYNLEDFLLPDMGWDVVMFYRDSTEQLESSPVYAENYGLFKEVVQTAREKGITVVVTIFPQNPGYAETGTFGIYGPRRSLAKKIIDEVSQLDVIMFDENKFGAHDYTANMAYNMDHLSATGSKQFTSRLDSLLSTLVK